MGGGLLQLVAYGTQDVYLSGNPQITFFKVVYRRHTNFAVEAIAQTFSGTPALGHTVSAKISRHGDLLSRVYLAVPLSYNETCGWDESALDTNLDTGHTSAVGFDDRDPRINPFSIISNAELQIGGQEIDKQTGQWMHLWTLLSHDVDQYELLERMMSPDNEMSYIPLQFWFCRNVGLALPLISLQYHEVKINIEFQYSNCTCYCFGKNNSSSCDSSHTNPDCCDRIVLWCDYIFLDTDERRKFAQSSHEYLIEQVQFQQDSIQGTGVKNIDLDFNHPVKELVWVLQDKKDDCITDQNYWKDRRHGADQIQSAILKINNHDRFSRRTGVFFRVVQRYEHHSGSTDSCVYLYSFAIKPERHQPSGTCNFSRINKSQLSLCIETCDALDGTMNTCCPNGAPKSTTCKTLSVYAVNYNVLRIMSGMGGLAYSN